MSADDRTPDEQELLDTYKYRLGCVYEVWDRFVLQGSFLVWDDAIAAAYARWQELLSIYDCRAVRVTSEIASVQAQDSMTFRWMTTSTVIVLRNGYSAPDASILSSAEFGRDTLKSSSGKWLHLPEYDFTASDYMPFSHPELKDHFHAA